MRNSEFRIRNSEFGIQNSEFGIENSYRSKKMNHLGHRTICIAISVSNNNTEIEKNVSLGPSIGSLRSLFIGKHVSEIVL